MDKYLLNLYKQFCDARGMICNPFDFKKYENEFIYWLAHNKILTNQYREFLLSLGYVDGKSISEIGKGVYDTLLLSDALIISPYAETMNLHNSELFMIGDCPLIQENGKILRPKTKVLLTHNPYEEMQIYNWFKIHNSGLYDISIGMYGNVHDGNYFSRIKMMEELSKRMIDDHEFDYDTDKDNYFCSINSKRFVKRKVLTR